MSSIEEVLSRARELIASGDSMAAVDALREVDETGAGNRDFEYLHALALANSGSLAQAHERVQALGRHLERDSRLFVDAQSLAGRIAKDKWSLLPPNDGRRPGLARESEAAYATAYEASGSPFPGINAASMGFLAGHSEAARALASRILESCAASPDGVDHWQDAVRAEALLLLGDVHGSRSAYERAIARAGGRSGDIASMRRQINLLRGHVHGADELAIALAAQPVIAFAGHMIDPPQRAPARFPAHLEEAVAAAIARSVRSLDPATGYTSAACGADILFIEEMCRQGREVHVLLPFRRPDFVATSVAVGGADWVVRFDRALESASSVSCSVSEGFLGDRCLFEYNSLLVQGAAILRARQLVTEPVLVAALGESGQGAMGGTAQTLAHWQGLGRSAHVIDIGALRQSSTAPTDPSAPSERVDTGEAPAPGVRRIRTMLFADVSGFSKLPEEEAPSFFLHFLHKVAQAIHASARGPVFVNTWGDGLFCVFEEEGAASEFALGLRDALRQTDWPQLGLPADLTVRIGMHTGPVFEAQDPVIGRSNFFGTHVNRAARLEPITPPGLIYVSEQTAALIAAGHTSGIACEYIGSVALPKDFGRSRVFRLRRAADFE